VLIDWCGVAAGWRGRDTASLMASTGSCSCSPCSLCQPAVVPEYFPQMLQTILQAKPPAREKLSLFGRQVDMYQLSAAPVSGRASVCAVEH
jgi:hypothetical protein